MLNKMIWASKQKMTSSKDNLKVLVFWKSTKLTSVDSLTLLNGPLASSKSKIKVHNSIKLPKLWKQFLGCTLKGSSTYVVAVIDIFLLLQKTKYVKIIASLFGNFGGLVFEFLLPRLDLL